MLPFSQFCLAMKVAAAGPVSQEDASAALQRYKKLEDSAPTLKQVGRYAGIGAVAAPVATVLKDTISGGKPLLGGAGNRLRTLAGNAVAGALTSGGIPLVRAHLDREAEKSTLRKYVAQGVAPKIAMDLFRFLPSDEFLKYAEANIGQWWENVGGPFLAKGGDHAEFKKMMEKADIPKSVQAKFQRMAAEKYPPKYNQRSGPTGRSSSSSSSGGQAGRAVPSNKQQALTAVLGAAALGSVGAYSAFAPQKEDPRKEYSKVKGALGYALTTVPSLAAAGYAVGNILSPRGAATGGLIGAGLGGALAAAGHRSSEADASRKGKAVFRRGSDSGLAKLEAAASRTSASHMRELMPAAVMGSLLGLYHEGRLGLMPVGSTAALRAVGTVGGGMVKKRHEYAALAEHDRMRKAAEAPLKKEKTSAMSGVTPAKPWAAGEYADMGKMGERVYAGDLHQLKDQPEWKEFRGLRDKGQYSPLVGAGVGGVVGAGLGALADRKLKGGNGMAVLGGMMGSGTGMLVGKHVRGLQAAPHSDLKAADEAALHHYALGRLLKDHEGNFKGAAGAPTRGGFLMASEVAPWRQPKLHTAIQHEPQQIVEKMGAARAEWLQKRAGATTPAGRLASSHRVGLPKVSAPPGPSIADTVPTFGQRLPGANKTTIGKRSIRETPTLASTAPPQG